MKRKPFSNQEQKKKEKEGEKNQTSSKVLSALRAEEVVRMPGPSEGVDALVTNGAIAVRALGGEEIVETLLTVGARVLLEEGG